MMHRFACIAELSSIAAQNFGVWHTQFSTKCDLVWSRHSAATIHSYALKDFPHTGMHAPNCIQSSTLKNEKSTALVLNEHNVPMFLEQCPMTLAAT